MKNTGKVVGGRVNFYNGVDIVKIVGGDKVRKKIRNYNNKTYAVIVCTITL